MHWCNYYHFSGLHNCPIVSSPFSGRSLLKSNKLFINLHLNRSYVLFLFVAGPKNWSAILGPIGPVSNAKYSITGYFTNIASLQLLTSVMLILIASKAAFIIGFILPLG